MQSVNQKPGITGVGSGGTEVLSTPAPRRIEVVTASAGSVPLIVQAIRSTLKTGQKVGATTVSVSDKQAGELLTYCAYGKQRRVRDEHVRRYVLIIKNNEWNPTSTLVFALFQGKLILMSGQHRLTAQREAGATLNYVVQVHMIHTDAELEALYSTVDSNTKNKDLNDWIAVQTDDNLGLEKTQRSRVGSAVLAQSTAFLEGSARNKANLSPRSHVQGVMYWAPTANILFKWLRGGDSTITARLTSASCLGVMLLYLHFNESNDENMNVLYEFVQSMIKMQAPAGSPAHTLFRFFAANTIASQGIAVYTRKVAGAVNAAMEERSMKKTTPIKRVRASMNSKATNMQNAAAPLRIVGENSPYNGKQHIYFNPANLDDPFTTEKPVGLDDVILSTDKERGRPKKNSVSEEEL